MPAIWIGVGFDKSGGTSVPKWPHIHELRVHTNRRVIHVHYALLHHADERIFTELKVGKLIKRMQGLKWWKNIINGKMISRNTIKSTNPRDSDQHAQPDQSLRCHADWRTGPSAIHRAPGEDSDRTARLGLAGRTYDFEGFDVLRLIKLLHGEGLLVMHTVICQKYIIFFQISIDLFGTLDTYIIFLSPLFRGHICLASILATSTYTSMEKCFFRN